MILVNLNLTVKLCRSKGNVVFFFCTDSTDNKVAFADLAAWKGTMK
jgi:hypothetical protein